MRKSSKKIAYLKGKATDRKGAGMELALLVLFVVFACSTLLVTSALQGKQRLQQQESRMVQRLEVEQVAQQAMQDAAFTHENYDIVRENSGMIIKNKQEAVLLTVSWDANRVITQWQYHGAA